MNRVVHESAWYVLTEVAPRAYRVDRTSQLFEGLRDIRAAAGPLLAILERDRPHKLLVDLRRAPARNDPEFERMFAPYRARMSRGAEHSALLLRSQVGRLQVQRLARADGVDLMIFYEEQAALDWLVADGPAR